MATIFRRTLLRYVRLMSSQTWYTNHGRKYIQLLCRRLYVLPVATSTKTTNKEIYFIYVLCTVAILFNSAVSSVV